jgi:hypothetical protein
MYIRRMLSWLHDPTGLLSPLLLQIAGLDDAMSLYRYLVIRGQVIVGKDHAAHFPSTDLSVAFSLRLEELEGVDVAGRYDDTDPPPVERTRYGEKIEDSSYVASYGGRLSLSEAPWERRMAEIGLSVTERGLFERDRGKAPQVGRLELVPRRSPS